MAVKQLSSMKEPLLSKQDDGTSSSDKKLLDKLRIYSLVIGFSIGCLVQFATMGVNCILILVLQPGYSCTTYKLFGLLWAFTIASLVSMIALLQYNMVSDVLSNKLDYSSKQVSEAAGYLAFVYMVGDVLGVYSCLIACEAALGVFTPMACLTSWSAILVWCLVVFTTIERERVTQESKAAEEEDPEFTILLV